MHASTAPVCPLTGLAWRSAAGRRIIHVSPPAKIGAALAAALKPVARVAFPPAAPVAAALYQCTAWTKAS